MVTVGNGAQWRGSATPSWVYHRLPRPGTRPKSKGSHMCRPLPNITGSCARGADPIGAFGLVRRRVTNCYHDLVCAGRRFLVGLDPVTIAYHAGILGWPLPLETFTNHYHREQGIRYTLTYSHRPPAPGGWVGTVIGVDNVAHGGEPSEHSMWASTVVGRHRKEKKFGIRPVG